MKIKCELECPKEIGTVCCFQCEHKEGCDEACDQSPSASEADGCGNAIFEEGTDLAVFETKQAAIIKNISDVVTAKKKLDEEEKKLKETLKVAMEQYSIKSFDNDVLKINYIAATTATTVDSKKLKEKYPDIASECSKTSNKSAYVKITVK